MTKEQGRFCVVGDDGDEPWFWHTFTDDDATMIIEPTTKAAKDKMLAIHTIAAKGWCILNLTTMEVVQRSSDE